MERRLASSYPVDLIKVTKERRLLKAYKEENGEATLPGLSHLERRSASEIEQTVRGHSFKLEPKDELIKTEVATAIYIISTKHDFLTVDASSNELRAK